MTIPADAGPVRRLERGLAWVLTSAGLLGLLAAVTLLVEKMALLRDSTYVPSCSINPVLSCGSVMTSPQAEAFGVPNPLLGLVGFTVVTTTGVALLAGARLPRWFWLGLQVGATAGVGFVHWLIAQSLYVIGALCPYCMLVWVVTITLFVGVTSRNLATGLRSRSAALRNLPQWSPMVVLGWLAVIAALIGVRFWDYWSLQLRAGHSPLVWLAAGAGLYVLFLAAAVTQRRLARTVGE